MAFLKRLFRPQQKRQSPDQDVQNLVDELCMAADPSARRSAAKELAKLGAPAVEPLIASLQHKDTEARRAAARVLGRIGDSRAVEPLVEIALGYIPKPLRADVERALLAIGEPALEPLIAGSKRSGGQKMSVAINLLGRLGDPRAVKPLIAALKDDSTGYKSAHVEALGRIGDARAVEPLVNALKYKDVRAAIARWLVKFGEPSVAPLIDALKDNEVRRTAAGALVKIGEPAVEPLIAALESPEAVVRKAAADALEKITALEHLDESARQAATLALEKIDIDELNLALKREKSAPRKREKRTTRKATAIEIKGIYLMTCSLDRLSKDEHSRLAGQALQYLKANNSDFRKVHAQASVDRPTLYEAFQEIGYFGQPFDVLISNFKNWIQQKGAIINGNRWVDYFFYIETPDPSEPLRKRYVLVYYHT